MNQKMIWKTVMALSVSALVLAGCQPSAKGTATKTETETAAGTEAEAAAPAAASEFAYVKDLDWIDPDTIPVVEQGLFLAVDKEGSLQILDANGESLTDRHLDNVDLFAWGADSFQATDEDARKMYVVKVSGQDISMQEGGGIGCAETETFRYDPNSGTLYHNAEPWNGGKEEAVPLDYLTGQDIESDNTYKVVGTTDDGYGGPWYLWSYDTPAIYGPFDTVPLFPFGNTLSQIRYFDGCRSAAPGLVAVDTEAGIQVLDKGTPAGDVYDAAVAVAPFFVFAQKGNDKLMVGPEAGTVEVLPAETEAASGISNGSVLILMDGVWKLYQKPGASDLVSSAKAQATTMTLLYDMHVRTGPAAGYESFEVLPQGTKVKVYAVQDTPADRSTWALIDGPDSNRWVCIERKGEVYLTEG